MDRTLNFSAFSNLFPLGVFASPPQTLRLNVEELQLLGEAWADRHRVLERSLTASSSSSSSSSAASASSASAASGKSAAGAGASSSSSSSSSTNAHIRALSALFRHRDTSVDEKEVIEDRLEVRSTRPPQIAISETMIYYRSALLSFVFFTCLQLDLDQFYFP
jgi:hypothetical protein